MDMRILLFLMPLLLFGAQAQSAAPKASKPEFSIREIMDAEVDPSADVIWDSVSTIVNAAGRTDKQPRTPEEWQAVRRSTVTLFESMNLITMPGRSIAPAGKVYPYEAGTEVLQKKLDGNRAAFLAFAQSVKSLSLKTLQAIDARDPQRLMDLGSELDEACEACHLVFWYPPELEPKR
jgi:hypothetical protein